MKPFIHCVLFDLDGTLADTAQDLAEALNATLRHFGRPPLPFERIRPEVSHGGIALIRLGFEIEPEDPRFETYRQYLLKHYQTHICQHTRLFDGMDAVLQRLCQTGRLWGIVTNKPSWLTEPLLQRLPLPCMTPCVISGDTCTQRKPHPQPLLHACRLLQVEPRHCLYVGDAQRDIQAGKAAGMQTVCACYGYLKASDRPDRWDADYHIDNPRALLSILNAHQ